jgi:hypothetical protein
VQERSPVCPRRQRRTQILVEKKQTLARARSAPQRTLELDEILQASLLAELLIMEDMVEIDQIKLPVCVPAVLDQQIGVTHISGIQPRCVERTQKFG